MKILIFLHGTLIMHRSGVGQTRQERVKQSQEREASVLDYAAYQPIGRAVEKLNQWKNQGAIIFYLSSHESGADVEKDKIVLEKFNFPPGEILYRKNGETYKDIVEKNQPDILIEDDCESIGGEQEMVITSIPPDLKKKIKSLVIKEFEGIDNVEI